MSKYLAVLALGFTGTAAAYERPYVLKKVVAYRCVTEYETHREAYQKNFTLYDDCGRPYTVVRTLYRDVRVPVQKTFPVVTWVKVYAD